MTPAALLVLSDARKEERMTVVQLLERRLAELDQELPATVTGVVALADTKREIAGMLQRETGDVAERLARALQDITGGLSEIESLMAQSDWDAVEAIEDILIDSINRRVMAVRWSAITRRQALRQSAGDGR